MTTFTDVFERKEVKYRLDARQHRAMAATLRGRMAPDAFGRTRIVSRYFDTPERALIERSLDKPAVQGEAALAQLRVVAGRRPRVRGDQEEVQGHRVQAPGRLLVGCGRSLSGRNAVRAGLHAIPASRSGDGRRVAVAAQRADRPRDRRVHCAVPASAAFDAHRVRARCVRIDRDDRRGGRRRRNRLARADRRAGRPAHHLRYPHRLRRSVRKGCRSCSASAAPRRRCRDGDQVVRPVSAVARSRARCVRGLPDVVLEVRGSVPGLHGRLSRRAVVCDSARVPSGRRAEGRAVRRGVARPPPSSLPVRRRTRLRAAEVPDRSKIPPSLPERNQLCSILH